MTLKSGLEVIQPGTIRKLGCNFLLAFHSNYGSILQYFRDKARYWSKIVIFSYPLVFDAPVMGSPSEYCYAVWHGKTRMAWLPNGAKILMTCLFVLTHLRTWQTHTQTQDIHRMTERARLMLASRGNYLWTTSCLLRIRNFLWTSFITTNWSRYLLGKIYGCITKISHSQLLRPTFFSKTVHKFIDSWQPSLAYRHKNCNTNQFVMPFIVQCYINNYDNSILNINCHEMFYVEMYICQQICNSTTSLASSKQFYQNKLEFVTLCISW